MKEIFILATLTSLSLLAFVILLVFGFIKRSKKLLISATILLFVSIGFGTYAFYSFINKSVNKFTEIMTFRNGDDIYDALFGKNENACLNVIHYRDQIIPIIDGSIWLHFKTCPREMKRILSRNDYKREVILPNEQSLRFTQSEYMKWFNPVILGDTVLIYEYTTDNNRNIQTMWSNLDSTEVFLRDILD